MTNLSRRGVLGAIICAPAIVRASSLMAVKAHKEWFIADFLTAESSWSMNLSEEALEHVRIAIDNQTGAIIVPARLKITGLFLEGDYPLREAWRNRVRATRSDGMPLFSMAHPHA